MEASLYTYKKSSIIYKPERCSDADIQTERSWSGQRIGFYQDIIFREDIDDMMVIHLRCCQWSIWLSFPWQRSTVFVFLYRANSILSRLIVNRSVVFYNNDCTYICPCQGYQWFLLGCLLTIVMEVCLCVCILYYILFIILTNKSVTATWRSWNVKIRFAGWAKDIMILWLGDYLSIFALFCLIFSESRFIFKCFRALLICAIFD